MRRFFLRSALPSVVLLTVVGAVTVVTAIAAGCGVGDADTFSDADGGLPLINHVEAGPVEVTEAGAPLDAGTATPSCTKYCDLVMTNCTGENAQYPSRDACLAFCAYLPPTVPSRGEQNRAASVACRQYWADSPAKTNPTGYCLAAGPFGGNVCGDRCTTFCSVLLNACTPDGGLPAYASQPDCASACTNFTLRDAGSDGGGESPAGPSAGDTLNCRLYHLRAATMSTDQCTNLAPDSGVCR